MGGYTGMKIENMEDVDKPQNRDDNDDTLEIHSLYNIRRLQKQNRK